MNAKVRVLFAIGSMAMIVVNHHVLEIAAEPSGLPLVDHPKRQIPVSRPTGGTPVLVPVNQKRGGFLLKIRGQMNGRRGLSHSPLV